MSAQIIAPEVWAKQRGTSSSDEGGALPYHEDMAATPTREEFDARIEAIESGMDARVERLSGDLRAYTAARDAQLDGLIQRMEERDKRFEVVVTSVAASGATAAKAAEDASNLKTTIIGWGVALILAALGASVALYFGIRQSNIGIVQVMQSSYQQGQQSGVQPLKPPAH